MSEHAHKQNSSTDNRQDQTPYASAISRWSEQNTVNLMVPGHGLTPEGTASPLSEFIGETALTRDIPPLIPGIDVGSASPLAQATELAAAAWHAKRTWFLTNGASQANRMAALALASRSGKDVIIAQRSAHSSFTDGVLLGDLLPRFVYPSIDTELGINHGITPAALEETFREAEAHGESVGAVYVISPSYFGAVSDVKALAEVAHAHGVPLVVDGAWGAHFGFHEQLPENPTTLGADIVVSSTHKMGGSLTQSAMLHLCEGPFTEELEPLLQRAYMLTQSTSANALLLGSLDVARHTLVHSKERISDSIAHVENFRTQLRAAGRFPLISDRFHLFPDIVDHDPLRLSIDISATGKSGHAVRDYLAEKHGIFLEISTARAIVAFIGPGKLPNLQRLLAGLNELADLADAAHEAAPPCAFPQLPHAGEMLRRPREAYFGKHSIVPAEQAIGRVSADALAAYPPGIPNVLPGEVITAETVEFLQQVAASPIGYVRGALDPAVSIFRVLDEN